MHVFRSSVPKPYKPYIGVAYLDSRPPLPPPHPRLKDPQASITGLLGVLVGVRLWPVKGGNRVKSHSERRRDEGFVLRLLKDPR